MKSAHNAATRRASMQGTAMLALGIILGVVAVVMSSRRMGGAAVILFGIGVVMLQRVGKSLR